MINIKIKKGMFIILSVFLILVLISSASATDESDLQLSNQDIDEVISADNTDNILTNKMSPAGDDSGLKELENSSLKSNSNNLLGTTNNDILSTNITVDGTTFTDIHFVWKTF